jgi:thioredoxin-related protein
MRYILILFLFIGGCTTTTQEEWYPSSLDYAVTSSLVAKYNTLDSGKSVPDGPVEPRVGDKCPECNNPPGQCGVGRVGDGRICVLCEKCGGDGRIDEKDLKPKTPEQPAPQKEEKKELGQTLRNEIFMYTRSGCSWCTKWEREVLPKLQSQGWKITKVNDTQNAVPHFKMYISGVEKTHRGFMPVSQFTQYFNEATGRDVKKN